MPQPEHGTGSFLGQNTANTFSSLGSFSPHAFTHFKLFEALLYPVFGAVRTPAGTTLWTAADGILPEVSLLEKVFGTGQSLKLTQWDAIHQLADLLHDTIQLLFWLGGSPC